MRSINSPALAVNPNDPANVVVASRIDSPQFGCVLHASLDGGANWTELPPPPVPDVTVPCFSPDVGFGPDGVLYLAFTTFATIAGHGTDPNAVWVARSTDGGQTFSAPVMALGQFAFHVQMAVDPKRAGRIYLSWVQAPDATRFGLPDTGNPIMVARSDDGGLTWQEPVKVSVDSRKRVVAPNIDVGARGDVQIVYIDLDEDALDYTGAHEGEGGDPYDGPWSIIGARSADAGATWEERVVDTGVRPIERFLMLFPPVPALVVGGHRTYVAFQDNRSGDADVVLWVSKDRGDSWSPPRQVNDTPVDDRSSQYLAQLGVAPDGRLDVVYYDRRRDSRDERTGVSLQSSFDGGRSFTAHLRLSDVDFDSGVGVGSDLGLPQRGSRVGIVSTARGALVIWSDTRTGDRVLNKQDLAAAVAAIHPGSPFQDPLQAAGYVMLALGAFTIGALSLRSLIRRRRRVPRHLIPGTQVPAGSDPQG